MQNSIPNSFPKRYLMFAAAWGAAWASFLQFNPLGQYLAIRRTWVTVVIGVGVDLLLALPLLPIAHWLRVVALITVSSLGIIFRSLVNEHVYNDDLTREALHGVTDNQPEKKRPRNK